MKSSIVGSICGVRATTWAPYILSFLPLTNLCMEQCRRYVI